MPATSQQEARAALEAAGQLDDSELDIAAVALQFARIDAPDADWRAAAAELSAIARRAVELAAADRDADGGQPEPRRRVLARLLHGEWGFHGDSETYEDMANANLIRVIERRRGLPVALGILWLHASEAVGWAAHGVNTPGHFLLALEHARGQIILDAFDEGRQLQPHQLREIARRGQGDQPLLPPAALAPMSKRDVLLRLQNNIKLRRLSARDFEGALVCTRDMLRLAPRHATLWREAGMIEHHLERIGAALQSLEKSLELEPRGEAAIQTRELLESLRNRLN
ncbi:SirB1 family protein [Roseococcus sp. YIM B11640]|uniref:SirB1 family protein n=1 Tax=Roseococcus sp. YIM B11640 TaxID=3133973 RepID=UPI003C7E4E40